MKYIAVIDTNVLVSALMKADSVPGKIVQFVSDGTIIPIVHEAILAEYEEVLNREKHHLPKDIVQKTINDFRENGIPLDGLPADAPIGDPKDVVFYEVTLDALQTDPAYLVTGNIRHFPIRPFIVTPRQMLEIIEKNY